MMLPSHLRAIGTSILTSGSTAIEIQGSATAYFNYFFYYEIINNVNLLIDNVEAAKGSEQDKKAILGQAYAYRGWAYFQMVQLYGERYNAACFQYRSRS